MPTLLIMQYITQFSEKLTKTIIRVIIIYIISVLYIQDTICQDLTATILDATQEARCHNGSIDFFILV